MKAPESAIARRHVMAAVIGNALECYDFLTYAFFAAQIGRVFYPTQTPFISLMLSLATFGAGFVSRRWARFCWAPTPTGSGAGPRCWRALGSWAGRSW